MEQAVYLATLVGTGLVLAAAFSSLIAFRFGAPLLLLFLAIGLAAGENGLGLDFDNAGLAYFLGSIALAVILFDSGFGTPVAILRQAAGPALTLATLGVVLTTVLFGAAAHFLMELSWLEALLLGAVVASTDAAAVFFLLRAGNINLRERVRATLEIESGTNDPIAIFLTITLVELIAEQGRGEALSLWAALGEFILKMGLGAAVGVAGGFLIVRLMERLDLDRGLTPIFVLALSLLVFAGGGAVGGSGFLAVYLAGLVAGNARIRSEASIRSFQEGLSWLAQIIMFLVLGLYATPSEFVPLLPYAVPLGLFLILVARPVAVWLCLLPFRFPANEAGFVAWVGLRGAVSILLGLTPILGGLEDGRLIFNIAFIVVLVSLVVQGWTVGPFARRLGLIVPQKIGPLEKVELELPGSAHHELLAYTVVPGSPVARGERLPHWARPSLVVRDGRSMRLREAGRLQAGDHVYIFVPDRYPRLLDRLFASPARMEPEDADFFGAFAVDPKRPAADLDAAYGPGLLGEDEKRLTIGALVMARLQGEAEYADRVSFGPIELIVRDVDENGRVSALGLSFEPATTEVMPILPGAAPVVRALSRWLRGRRDPASTGGRKTADMRVGHTGASNHKRNEESGMAGFKTIDAIGDVRGKRALVRVDLNVPFEDGQVTDNTRIERVAPTIRELSDKGAKVILLAHFGRPKAAPDPKYTLEPIARASAEVLGRPVAFATDCVGEAARAAVENLGEGEVLLLENTRFHAGEEKNDPDFVRQLAENGDLYVNDAFSAAHRAHASTEGLAHVLPAFAGRTMQAELEALEKGLGSPERPVVAVVGGAKVSTKIDLLLNLVRRVDALVIGGGMANTFLAARGLDVGKSLCEHDLGARAREIEQEAAEAGCALVLPVDAVVAREFRENAPSEVVPVEGVPADGMILDVGPQSVDAVKIWIGRAKTLVWNGPLGAFETKPFDRGTVEAARFAAERTKAGALVSVAGGGDTVAALNEAGVAEDFTYVSTAGGAFLEWMEGKALPGVEALKR